MVESESTFIVKYEGKSLSGVFTPTGDWSAVSKYGNFSTWVEINNYPWLCRNIWGTEKCAMNYYNWTSAQIRPVMAKMMVDIGILPGIEGGAYSSVGIDSNVLGGAQMTVNLGITGPQDCPSHTP